MKKRILATLTIIVLFAATACKEKENSILKSSKPTVEEPILTKINDFSKTIIKGRVPEVKELTPISFQIKGEKAIVVKTDKLGVFEIEIDTPKETVKATVIATEPNKLPSDPLEITISPAQMTATPVVELPIISKEGDPSKLILKGRVEGAKDIVTLTLDSEGKESLSFKSDKNGVFEVEIDAPESDLKAKLTAVETYKAPSSPLEIIIPKLSSNEELYFTKNKEKYYAFRGTFSAETEFPFMVEKKSYQPSDSILVVIEVMNADELIKREFYTLNGKKRARLRSNINTPKYRAHRINFKLPSEFVDKDIIVYTKNNQRSEWVKGLNKILNYGEDVFYLNYQESESFEIEAQLTDIIIQLGGVFANAVGEKYPGIEHWDTKMVTNAGGMFAGARNFNQDLPNWDLRSVSIKGRLDDMFWGAENFNGDISGWKVSGVKSMSAMFYNAKIFNGDISKWEVSSVSQMQDMFYGAESFNGDITAWNTRSLTDTYGMFRDAKSFNQDIGNWDVSKVTSISRMFSGAESFNQDISRWNVSRVDGAVFLFQNAKKFNQDISAWKFSPRFKNMWCMFKGAESFNQDISKWDVSNIEKMESVFEDAKSFSYDLSGWNVEKVIVHTDFNKGAPLLTDEKCPKWKE